MMAQSDYVRFSEADKAIAAIENKPAIIDSLKSICKGKYLVRLTFGNQFISKTNQTPSPDTITFADFSEKHSYFGVGAAYYFSSKFYAGMNVKFMMLPKDQDISSISFNGGGISGSGKGSGGAIVAVNLMAKYAIHQWKHNHLYLATELGTMNLLAKGGTVDFNSVNGSENNINEQKIRLKTAQLITGISNRVSPGMMLDFNLGYQLSSKTEPIGGITSVGGLNTSISVYLILNHQNN